MLDVKTDCPGEHDFLEIPSLADEILYCVPVSGSRDILLDDGSLIQILGRVMRGGPNQLDPTPVGLTVGVGADERRQERMMDVDHRTSNLVLRNCH